MTEAARPKRQHRHSVAALCLTLLVVLSFVLVTGARRAALVTYAATQVEFAEYLAIGGAFEDLCRDGGIPHPGSSTCDACRQPDIAVLPDLARAPEAVWIATLDPILKSAGREAGTVFANPAAPARGPPMIA